MRSLPPQDFDILPTLATPAGYICVIRDIDSDNFRIEGTNQPKTLVDTVLAESDRSFGIELVSILETEDLAASEAELYERYQARLSSDWLELDEYQLDELRRSILQIDAHASHYLTPERPPYAKSEMPEAPDQSQLSDELLGNAYYHGPNRGQWKRRRPREPMENKQYGAQSLRRYREEARQRRLAAPRKSSPEERAGELFEDLLVNHARKVVAVIILISLITTLVSLYIRPYSY